MTFIKKHKILTAIIAILIFLISFAVGAFIMMTMAMKEGSAVILKEEEITEEMLLSENVPIIEVAPEYEAGSGELYGDGNVFNVLLIGSDSRDPNSDRGRSDSMMMVSFNKEENKATLASFLRDTLVDVPGYERTRLGHSFAYGGAGLAINTINQTYGLDIQNYIVINFDNLENVIDKIGGIDLNITAEEARLYQSRGYSYIHEGMNHLNGADCLMHARNRSIGNDFERTRRQRDLLFGIYQRVMETKDPADMLSLVEYCFSQVKTNMKVSAIYGMALDVIKIENLEVQQIGLPMAGTYQDVRYDGMAVLEIDVEANKEALYELLY